MCQRPCCCDDAALEQSARLKRESFRRASETKCRQATCVFFSTTLDQRPSKRVLRGAFHTVSAASIGVRVCLALRERSLSRKAERGHRFALHTARGRHTRCARRDPWGGRHASPPCACSRCATWATRARAVRSSIARPRSSAARCRVRPSSGRLRRQLALLLDRRRALGPAPRHRAPRARQLCAPRRRPHLQTRSPPSLRRRRRWRPRYTHTHTRC